MEKSLINSELHTKYNLQYESEMEGWRETGALFKALNIKEISTGYNFEKVLEVGAGDGSILRFLDQFKFAKELYALEISVSGIKKIKEKNIPSLHEVSLFDGYNIPYPDKSFDLVVLSHVLEHVEYERTLLREIKRVSKYQIIEVPKDYRRGVDKRVKHFLSYGHINVYTPSSLKYLLKTEGFEIVKQHLGVYNYKVFKYMAANNFKKKLVYFLAYNFKKMIIKSPFSSLKDKYCNTITLFTKPDKEGINIF